MGGGTAMRAASKVAGLGVGARVVGGLRGAVPAAAPAEQAMRKSSVPVSAILSSSATATADVAPVQRPAMELDGWEFAGGEDDLVISAGEPMPRVVFTGVPGLHEAKEATVELKEALDTVYLSSPKSPKSWLSLFSKPDPESNSLHVVGAVPSHALRAFKLLSTSPEVQNVVASIASDEKVWNAVMENPVLQEFLESNKKTAESEESVPKKSEDSSDSSNTESWGNRFKGMFKNAKGNVANLVSSLSTKFQNIFGLSSDAKEAEASHTIGIGTSILGLVTMVIMVVLLKRI